MGLFRKKTKLEKLQVKYNKLVAEAHKLSYINRKLSDEKNAEAMQIMKQIEEWREKNDTNRIS